MEILRIEELLETLRTGGIILHPNDTVWGLACNAFNEASVERLRQIKKRPVKKPFILLASSLEMVRRYVTYIHPRLETLLQYHQRPLTVIYEQVCDLPEYLLTAEKAAAIRVSLDPFTQSLINKLGNPLISTSANFTAEPYLSASRISIKTLFIRSMPSTKEYTVQPQKISLVSLCALPAKVISFFSANKRS